MKRSGVMVLVSAAALLGFASVASAIDIVEFRMPSSSSAPSGIVAGPDGALWFTETAAGKIGRSTVAGQITEYSLPAGALPAAITAGPDGALWFTDQVSRKIGRITTAGAITQVDQPGSGAPVDIVGGPDGNIWYTTALFPPGPGPIGKIGRMTPSGAATEFDVPFPARIASALAVGPDGNIWFAGYGSQFPVGYFGVVGSITTAGDAHQLQQLAVGIPQDLTAGPDGGMWFTVQIETSLAALSPRSTIGKIVHDTPNFLGYDEFLVPSSDSAPSAIVAGPDGAMWFTDLSLPSRIGRITTSGAITELSTASTAGGITGGPTGTVWFTEPQIGKIARVSELSAICTPSPTALCLENGRFRIEATWTTSDGATGAGNAVPLATSSTAGYFWFFSPETPEVTVKMVNGCNFNFNHWFFAGGLTDVRVDLKVTDTSGFLDPKTYTNPLGTAFLPIQDIAAFWCGPVIDPVSARPESARRAAAKR